MAGAVAWCVCACALLAARAASAPPVRTHVKDSKPQEKTIVVRRLPNSYYYPFSLWPLPKFPVREGDEFNENIRYRRDIDSSLLHRRKLVLEKRQNER